MTQVISIANPKGGSGKTTTSINLAACAAKDKKRVLLIDMDPNRSATKILGVDRVLSPREMDERNAGLLFNDDARKPSALTVSMPQFGFDILPGTYDLAKAEHWLMESDDGGSMHLLDLFDQDEGLKEYDIVLIDTGGRVGRMLYCVLMASDRIIAPTTTSQYSTDQIAEFMPFVDRVHKLKARMGAYAGRLTHVSHIVLVNVREQTKAAVEGMDRLLALLPEPELLAETYIPSSTVCEDAANQLVPVVQMSPKHLVSRRFCELYNEVIRDYGRDA